MQKNIGILHNTQNVFFVPYFQDSPDKKSNSLISDISLLLPTIEKALIGKQIQPVNTTFS